MRVLCEALLADVSCVLVCACVRACLTHGVAPRCQPSLRIGDKTLHIGGRTNHIVIVESDDA
jgi:hypothetical protein